MGIFQQLFKLEEIFTLDSTAIARIVYDPKTETAKVFYKTNTSKGYDFLVDKYEWASIKHQASVGRYVQHVWKRFNKNDEKDINKGNQTKPFYQRTAEQKPSNYKGDGTKPLKDSTFGTAAKSSTPTKRKRDSFFELDTLDSL